MKGRGYTEKVTLMSANIEIAYLVHSRKKNYLKTRDLDSGLAYCYFLIYVILNQFYKMYQLIPQTTFRRFKKQENNQVKEKARPIKVTKICRH